MDNFASQQVQKSTRQHADYLSKDVTVCMKGILAVCVLIHHVYQYSGLFRTTVVLSIFLQALGYLSVSGFFFFTGYGMTISKSKQGYIKTIWRKRILPLYAFYCILVVLYYLWRLFLQSAIPVSIFIQSFFWGATIVPLGWYLQTTFLVYIFFWLTFIFFRNNKNCTVFLFVILTVYCFLCRFCGLESTWYETIFSTLLGMLWANNRDIVDAYIKKKTWIKLVVWGFLFSIAFLLSEVASWVSIELKMISAIVFVICMLIMLYALPSWIYINSVTRWVGRHSFEIYICQGFFLLLRKDGKIYINNPYIFAIITLCGTFLVAIFMKPLFEGVTSKFKKLFDKDYL